MKPVIRLLFVSSMVVVAACGGRAERDRTGDPPEEESGDGGSASGSSTGNGGTDTGGAGSGGAGGAPSSGGAEGSGGGDFVIAPPPQGDNGSIAVSCGYYIYVDGMDIGPDPIDCTAYGDVDAICVFSNHCYCSEGFRCALESEWGQECDQRVTCVPDP
jgi:hypothetical protein